MYAQRVKLATRARAGLQLLHQARLPGLRGLGDHVGQAPVC